MPRREVTNQTLSTKLDMIHEMLKDHVDRFEQHVRDDELVAKQVNETATTMKVLKWVIGAGFAVVGLIAGWFK